MSHPHHTHFDGEDVGVLEVAIFLEQDTGVGEESQLLRKRSQQFFDHYRTPVSRQQDDPGTRFHTLRRQWEEATLLLSSTNEMAIHPAYQQIIGMGNLALPFIMHELRLSAGHWFWALKAITGEDPVPHEKRGKIKEMTDIWLAWWRRHGHDRYA